MLTRIDALRTLVDALPDCPVVATCGLTSRELASLGERPNHLYVLNSMGLAGPIGMGLALGLDTRTLVIEGDGGLLMELSFLSTLAHVAPAGLLLAVLDNGAYCSTGGQSTAATTVDLGKLAEAAGLAVFRASTPPAVAGAVREATAVAGPAFLHVRISTASAPGVPYLQPDPPAVTARFRDWLAERGMVK